MGTDATRPIEPTSARTISTATTSRVATEEMDWPASWNNRSSGRAAPAYARNSVLTVDEMWSRPMRTALRYRSVASASGRARLSSHTAETWVTVTSSRTPSDPMTTPASRRPLGSIPVPSAPRKPTDSSARPVNRVAPTNTRASTAVIARLATDDSNAAAVASVNPCARNSAMNAMAPAATRATATAFDPARIAGRTNARMTNRLAASPASAPAPRQRPRTRIDTTNSSVSSSRGVERWKS